MSNYIGFKIHVPQFLAPMFFTRCKNLGYCFNNGSTEDRKLKDYKECVAYIFWNNSSSRPYVGSNLDYEDALYYEKYAAVKLSTISFMAYTRFSNMMKKQSMYSEISTKSDKDNLKKLMMYGEIIHDNTKTKDY